MIQLCRTAEAARLLALSPYRLNELKKAGHFVEGEHYFRPRGMGVRWSTEALERYVKGERPKRRRERVNGSV